MTNFDAKLAELESQTDRVPELKLVVELLRIVDERLKAIHKQACHADVGLGFLVDKEDGQ